MALTTCRAAGPRTILLASGHSFIVSIITGTILCNISGWGENVAVSAFAVCFHSGSECYLCTVGADAHGL